MKKKVVKTLRKVFRKSLAALPKERRDQIYRRMIRLDYELPAGIRFKLAQSREELEQAFALLHDSYVASGFMEPHPSGLRVTPYHALPTTSTLVAVIEDRVVGTVSIIRDNPLCMPLQSIFDIEPVKSRGSKVAEISSLAIHPEYRNAHGALLFPMFRFVYDYCRHYFDLDQMFISVNPKHIALYEALLRFERLPGGEVNGYAFVNGAPAVGAFMDLRLAFNRLFATYSGCPPRRDIFSYFMVAKPFANFEFPDRTYMKVSDPVMTPELLKYFLVDRTDLLVGLSELERKIITAQYRGFPSYHRVLPPSAVLVSEWLNREHRFDVNCRGFLSLPGHPGMSALAVTRVSQSGFRGDLRKALPLGQRVSVRIEINALESVSLEAAVAWENGTGIHGFRVVRGTAAWEKFIAYLEQDRNQSGAA